jgi:hypothetical protein
MLIATICLIFTAKWFIDISLFSLKLCEIGMIPGQGVKKKEKSVQD